ncbi:MAG: sigma factor-like helix-turn-helix DNA-binding protein [Paracoccaceae bacterium]
MALSWHALHAQLVEHTRRVSFRRDLQILCTVQPELGRFPDADALLAWQHDLGGAPESRELVLRALIGAAQSGCCASETAQSLVLLALWPGCDAVYGRLRRFFRGEADRLAAEITGRLSVQVMGLDLDRVNRLAATLVRNTERDIRRMLRREWQNLERGGLDEAEAEALPPSDLHGDPARLLDRLSRVVGQDAALVLAVAVMGATQKEAGRALGLGHEAARKRYQRALQKLRAAGFGDVPN